MKTFGQQTLRYPPAGKFATKWQRMDKRILCSRRRSSWPRSLTFTASRTDSMKEGLKDNGWLNGHKSSTRLDDEGYRKWSGELKATFWLQDTRNWNSSRIWYPKSRLSYFSESRMSHPEFSHTISRLTHLESRLSHPESGLGHLESGLGNPESILSCPKSRLSHPK